MRIRKVNIVLENESVNKQGQCGCAYRGTRSRSSADSNFKDRIERAFKKFQEGKYQNIVQAAHEEGVRYSILAVIDVLLIVELTSCVVSHHPA